MHARLLKHVNHELKKGTFATNYIYININLGTVKKRQKYE